VSQTTLSKIFFSNNNDFKIGEKKLRLLYAKKQTSTHRHLKMAGKKKVKKSPDLNDVPRGEWALFITKW
jgi:hypothetical protein